MSLLTTHTAVAATPVMLYDLSAEQESMRRYAGGANLSAFYALSIYVPPVGHADNPNDLTGVWVGGSAVSASNGRWVPAGTALDIDLPPATEIYAVSPDGAISLHVMVVTP